MAQPAGAGIDQYGDALPGEYIERDRVERFCEIKPYEAPQYLVEIVGEWRRPSTFGGWSDTLTEARLLSDNVRGWGPANAIIMLYDHATGEWGHYLAVMHEPQVIDHVKGDPADNDIENLEAMSPSEHRKMHEEARKMLGGR